MDFAELVKRNRQLKFRTVRDFYEAAGLPCTYYYYSAVERGRIPSVEITMAILDALKIDRRRGLWAWVRSQMPTPETRSYFMEFDSDETLEDPDRKLAASSILVINRAQAALLQSNPLLMEVLIFINAYDAEEAISIEKISSSFGSEPSEMEALLEDLFRQGMIEKSPEGRFFSKQWVFTPFEREFEPFKEVNFRRAYEQFCAQAEEERIRNTATIRVTAEQRVQLESRIRALMNWFVSFESEKPPSDAQPYTFGIFGSPRRFGNGRKNPDRV